MSELVSATLDYRKSRAKGGEEEKDALARLQTVVKSMGSNGIMSALEERFHSQNDFISLLLAICEGPCPLLTGFFFAIRLTHVVVTRCCMFIVCSLGSVDTTETVCVPVRDRLDARHLESPCLCEPFSV
jgi:hypothetical protein